MDMQRACKIKRSNTAYGNFMKIMPDHIFTRNDHIFTRSSPLMHEVLTTFVTSDYANLNSVFTCQCWARLNGTDVTHAQIQDSVPENEINKSVDSIHTCGWLRTGVIESET